MQKLLRMGEVEMKATGRAKALGVRVIFRDRKPSRKN